MWSLAVSPHTEHSTFRMNFGRLRRFSLSLRPFLSSSSLGNVIVVDLLFVALSQKNDLRILFHRNKIHISRRKLLKFFLNQNRQITFIHTCCYLTKMVFFVLKSEFVKLLTLTSVKLLTISLFTETKESFLKNELLFLCHRS